MSYLIAYLYVSAERININTGTFHHFAFYKFEYLGRISTICSVQIHDIFRDFVLVHKIFSKLRKVRGSV
jgi:hypothetical protein